MLTSPRARSRALALALTAAAVGGTIATAAPASATTLGQQVVREASSHNGMPYVYGATGPTKFDCSGFTLYVWGRFGKRLPHNSAQQYSSSAVRHIAKSDRTTGDLIFMKNSSGRITHVGIYADGNRWWVAPKSGDHVKLQTLYSNNFVVARVR
jgi:cell wall-associated NlpC family hydrolase